MFYTLSRYLHMVIPSEQANLIMDTLVSIRTHRGDSIDNIVSNFLSMIDENDTTTNLESLYDLLFDLSIETFKHYGIFLKEAIDDYRVEDIFQLLDGLSGFETYEDPYGLRHAIEESEDDIEAFCTCLAIVNDTDKSLYYPYIAKINDGFIERLYQVLGERSREVYADTEDEVDVQDTTDLKRLIDSPYFQYVDKVVASVLSRQPRTLSIRAILRAFGNRMADNTHGEYTWLFAVYASQENDLGELYYYWGKHFLEEHDLIRMKQRVDNAHRTLTQQEETNQ